VHSSGSCEHSAVHNVAGACDGTEFVMFIVEKNFAVALNNYNCAVAVHFRLKVALNNYNYALN
jgi:hypothetical protein